MGVQLLGQEDLPGGGKAHGNHSSTCLENLRTDRVSLAWLQSTWVTASRTRLKEEQQQRSSACLTA